MFAGHNFYLVALSVAIAVLGGYVGFGLAARVRAAREPGRRLLLAGAAAFLAVGIWTMHFIGMLAAPIPDDAVYLVLPTIVSFLICALVVGISLFFVSVGPPSGLRVAASALLLGAGIVSMHYVGIHGLAGDFHIEHDGSMVALSGLIAVATAYGGLNAFLARQGGRRLVLSAVAFGLAVSGMHYTAMYGMRFEPGGIAVTHHTVGGLSASPQMLALVVALLCFVIAAGFLLFLVPEPPRPETVPPVDMELHPLAATEALVEKAFVTLAGQARPGMRPSIAPLGGLGQPRPVPVSRMPVEGADGIHLIDVSEVRGVRADAHYTFVHDGTRERMSPWSISEAGAQLDPDMFIRVHRSHIVAIAHVSFVRKEGDGGVVELDGPAPHRVPVSRARMAELRERLGLISRRPGSSQAG